ncbi:MAG: hypothetical protein ACU85V_15390 [Gammaproteobacteria bacterium]
MEVAASATAVNGEKHDRRGLCAKQKERLAGIQGRGRCRRVSSCWYAPRYAPYRPSIVSPVPPPLAFFRTLSGVSWLLALTAVGVLYLRFNVSVGFAGFVADDALYLLMADAYAGTSGEPALLEYVRAHAHLPPLFPLLLAGVGAGSATFGTALELQAVLAISALVMWAACAARVLGGSVTGPLVLLALAALPAALLFSTEVWSEFLYLALTGAAFLCAERAADERNYWIYAALLAGLAAVTRGFGLVAVIALLSVVARRAPRMLPVATALAAAPAALGAGLGLGTGGDYLEFFLDRVPDLAALGDVVAENLSAGASGLLGLYGSPTGIVSVALCTLLGSLAVIGGALRLCAWRWDAVYAAGYVVLLLIWPFPAAVWRLVFPLLPLALIHAAVAGGALAAMLAPHWEHRARLVVVSLVLALSITHCAPLAARYLDDRLPDEYAHWRASRYWLTASSAADGVADVAGKQAMLELMRAARGRVEPGQCIHARHPQPVMLHARRPSWPAPVGAARPSRPECRYHLVVSDRLAAESYAALWPGYEVLETRRVGNGVAAVLVRYPE